MCICCVCMCLCVYVCMYVCVVCVTKGNGFIDRPADILHARIYTDMYIHIKIMNINIYTHIHIHTYTHVHIYTYTYTHLQTYAHNTLSRIDTNDNSFTHTHVHIYTYAYAQIQTYTHNTLSRIDTNVYHVYICIHARARTHIHTCTHIHVCIHTRTNIHTPLSRIDTNACIWLSSMVSRGMKIIRWNCFTSRHSLSMFDQQKQSWHSVSRGDIQNRFDERVSRIDTHFRWQCFTSRHSWRCHRHRLWLLVYMSMTMSSIAIYMWRLIHWYVRIHSFTCDDFLYVTTVMNRHI